jgi:transposase
MLSKEDFAVIKALKKQGVYHKDIAAELGVHPKTVSRALRRGEAPRRQWRKRGSLLEPFKGRVDELLAEGVWNAMVILREIESQGYSGKITILRDYIRPKRALRPGRATVRFETEPGQQMQSDWGAGGDPNSRSGDESAFYCQSVGLLPPLPFLVHRARRCRAHL